ncbi:hypothetical protein AaE_001571 [Aphanomyces astaci]|uniref:Uncharacterized protein n=1 Tax=Aphanomyces astaci TaxID=112090 RepID=A0A6A5AW93_APHAT|nr:hypothetical protein AaE_001571 [Aphanomyces astaci]
MFTILGNCGAKKVWSANDIKIAIKAVPHEGRQTLRSTAAKSGIPKKSKSSETTPHGRQQGGANSVCYELPSTPVTEGHVFVNMHNYVHVDEKWFFITTVKRRFYLYDELLAERAAKVMFLAAVACPRYDPHKKKMFDGKIGIWPFVKKLAALRMSRNRLKGALEFKPHNVDASTST